MARVIQLVKPVFGGPSDRYNRQNEAVYRQDVERVLESLSDRRGQFRSSNVDLATIISVSRADLFTITNSAPTTVTAFDNGSEGQVITLIFADGNTTIQDASVGGVIQLSGGANFTPTADDTLVLVFDGTNWYEISRSLN